MTPRYCAWSKLSPDFTPSGKLHAVEERQTVAICGAQTAGTIVPRTRFPSMVYSFTTGSRELHPDTCTDCLSKEALS